MQRIFHSTAYFIALQLLLIALQLLMNPTKWGWNVLLEDGGNKTPEDQNHCCQCVQLMQFVGLIRHDVMERRLHGPSVVFTDRTSSSRTIVWCEKDQWNPWIKYVLVQCTVVRKTLLGSELTMFSDRMAQDHGLTPPVRRTRRPRKLVKDVHFWFELYHEAINAVEAFVYGPLATIKGV